MTTSLVIGDYEIATVLDSPAPLRDPAIIFPSVPPAAWDPYRSFALDPDGKWPLDWRGHLIRATYGEGPVILVDAGMGADVN